MEKPMGEIVSKKFYIFPLSDLHLGSKQCDLQFFHKWRRVFEECPDNKCIYLLGDLLEFPTTRIDAYSSSMSTHDALERLIGLLSPYKEYIRYCVTGNHEARAIKDFSYDITKSIASRLDVPYSRSDFFDTLHLEGGDLVVYGKHGTRTSKNAMLSMKNFIYDMADVEADLHLMGHNHYCEFVSKYQRDAQGGRRKYYGFTGMFLGYDGYARNKGLAMSQPAFMRLSVDKNLHIDCKKYYKDEIM